MKVFFEILNSFSLALIPFLLHIKGKTFSNILYYYTVKNFSGIFPKIVRQLKIQMSRKFFQRYSWKYFRHKTENSSYCLVGEISTLLGKIDIFHNLSGKRSKKSEQISVFVEYNM